MIDHLKACGGSLDFADTKTLIVKRGAEWDISENPQKYFNRVEQAIKVLTHAGITSDPNEQRDMALYYLKSSGEFDAAVQEWGTNRQQTKLGHTSNVYYDRIHTGK
jgi:hypothetical protein